MISIRESFLRSIGIVAGILILGLNSCTGLKKESDTSQNKNNAVWLIPTPKESEVGKALHFKDITYSIIDSMDMPTDAVKRLESELLKKLEWKKPADTSNGFPIKIKKLNSAERKEFYTLKISQEEIEISAASKDGIYRGIGRLFGIIDSPLVKFLPDGSISCPAISIRDWPDYPMRGMQLRLVGKIDEDMHKRYIDVIARLGFNFIVIEIGGFYESDVHPECCLNPRWTKKQLKDLISYAESYGLMAIPEINAIGHLRTGPVICPIEGTRDKNKKKEPIVSNISIPEYYKTLFNMIDELSALFGNPPYFHIGTDEFAFYEGVELLEKTTGKSGHELYADFLDKVNKHLMSKNMKMVIWHDMLIPPGIYNRHEPANGTLTSEAFIKMDRNIVIDYWCYDKLDNYKFLEKMSKSGFNEIWISPWDEGHAVAALCQQGFKLGAKAVLGTTWNRNPALEALPQTGEFSWNAAVDPGKPFTVYETINKIFFYGRGTKKSQTGISKKTDRIVLPSSDFLKKLADAYPDMNMNASGFYWKMTTPASFFVHGVTFPPAIPEFHTESELLKNGKLEDMLIYVKGNREWVLPTVVNKKREADQKVIYTPEYGPSTRTNMYGLEFEVKSGKITRISDKGNMEIPADGFVISAHGISDCNFWKSVKAGDEISILKRNPKFQEEKLSVTLDSERFIVFVTTEYPISPDGCLARFDLSFSDGTKESFKLNSGMFSSALKSKSLKWKTWIADDTKFAWGLMPVLAVEWEKGSKNAVPQKLNITACRDGIESELIVLGVVEY